jgi:hypothetical protein
LICLHQPCRRHIRCDQGLAILLAKAGVIAVFLTTLWAFFHCAFTIASHEPEHCIGSHKYHFAASGGNAFLDGHPGRTGARRIKGVPGREAES